MSRCAANADSVAGNRLTSLPLPWFVLTTSGSATKRADLVDFLVGAVEDGRFARYPVATPGAALPRVTAPTPVLVGTGPAAVAAAVLLPVLSTQVRTVSLRGLPPPQPCPVQESTRIVTL